MYFASKYIIQEIVMDNELNINDQFVLMLSRLTISEKNEELIGELIKNENIYWPRIFQTAIQNKVLGLLYDNLKKLDLLSKIPSRYEKNAKYFYLGNAIRNSETLEEYEKVIRIITDEGVKAVPLKGIYLTPNMYKNYGSREMSDVDLLVKKEDCPKLIDIMTELGYEQGSYNKKTGKVDAYSKEKKMLWKMNMNTMIPFAKPTDSPYSECFKFDISFNLDLKLDPNPVPWMIDRANKVDELWHLKPSDFFIHLCCHLYKEASNAEWIYQNKDINLIKFCDVREYIIQKMSTEDVNEAIETAIEFNVKNAIYYTVYYLKMIYYDGYEDSILNKLEVKDLNFLNEFGQNNFKEPVQFKKNFWERIFSDSNAEELKNLNKFVDKYKNI